MFPYTGIECRTWNCFLWHVDEKSFGLEIKPKFGSFPKYSVFLAFSSCINRTVMDPIQQITCRYCMQQITKVYCLQWIESPSWFTIQSHQYQIIVLSSSSLPPLRLMSMPFFHYSKIHKITCRFFSMEKLYFSLSFQWNWRWQEMIFSLSFQHIIHPHLEAFLNECSSSIHFFMIFVIIFTRNNHMISIQQLYSNLNNCQTLTNIWSCYWSKHCYKPI